MLGLSSKTTFGEEIKTENSALISCRDKLSRLRSNHSVSSNTVSETKISLFRKHSTACLDWSDPSSVRALPNTFVSTACGIEPSRSLGQNRFFYLPVSRKWTIDLDPLCQKLFNGYGRKTRIEF